MHSASWPAFGSDDPIESSSHEIDANQTLTATIWGDSELSGGEDDTGSNCGEHDSRGVHSNGCLLIPVRTGGAGTLAARLSWTGSGTEMGVFVSTGLYAGLGI